MQRYNALRKPTPQYTAYVAQKNGSGSGSKTLLLVAALSVVVAGAILFKGNNNPEKK